MARRSTAFDPRWGTVRADSWIWDFHVDPAADAVLLRDELVPREKREGETRVLFVGDSGTEGVLLPTSEAYPALFEERVGGGIRAINAGVFGMTTIDELHLLKTRLLPLGPDVVVVGVFMSNDINFNLAHSERLRDVSPRTGWAREVTERSALASFLFHEALAANARYRWVDADDLAEESIVPREVALIDERGLHMLSYPMGEIATYVQPPSALVERAYEVLEQALWRFRSLGRDHGFEVRVLIVPTPSAVARDLRLLHYPRILEELRAQGIEVDEADLDFDAPTRRVLAICEELELRCTDPTPRMREIGMTVFFADDEHPTATGHAILAAALADDW